MNRSLLAAACRLSVIALAALASPACSSAVAKSPACPAPPAAAPALATAPAGAAVTADDDVAIDDFTAPLGVYGAWVDVAPYGRVWQPGAETVGQDFMPYGTGGQWAVNEDGDWVFEGKHDDAFGWATYHYGRWLQHDEYGWVWIPGTTWAPAWVAWRFGGGHVGWAPAGPEGAGAPPERWVVVEEKSFLDEGAIRARLDAGRVDAVWSAMPPVAPAHAGRGHGGPPAEAWKALGLAPKVSHVKKPGRGETREKARAVALKGAGKPAAKARARAKAGRGKGMSARNGGPKEKKGEGGSGSGSKKK